MYIAQGPYIFAETQPRRAPRSAPSTEDSPPDASPSTFDRDASGILDHLHGLQTAGPAELNMERLQLVLQWILHTHKLLARNEETRKVWEMTVLQEGLQAPFLMHGIMALSALHLSLRGDEKASWLSMAIRAPADFLDELKNHEPLALVVLAHYCLFLHLAREKWCIRPWGKMVLQEIRRRLSSGWQHHIEWAVSEVLDTTES